MSYDAEKLYNLLPSVYRIRDAEQGEVLRQLVQPLLRSKFIDREKPFLDRLLDRERIVSTAVGRGVAIPHLRKPEENPGGGPVLVVGICPEGTNFEAPDGEKTHLFFLLSTDSEVVHLRVLAKVNRIARRKEVITDLIGCKSPAEVLRVLITASQKGEAT